MIPLVLVLQALVFLLWAWTAFATVFDWRRRGAALSGGLLPGPRALLPAIGGWWRDPAAKGQRRRLIALTLALLATTALWAATMGPPGA